MEAEGGVVDDGVGDAEDDVATLATFIALGGAKTTYKHLVCSCYTLAKPKCRCKETLVGQTYCLYTPPGSGRRLRSIVQVRAYLNRLVGEEDSAEEGGVDMGAAAQDSGVEDPPGGVFVEPRVELLGSEGAEVAVMAAAHVVDTCA
jgi:hypothetical protein